MGIFDESERSRTKVSQARSRVRTARRSWPLSARLLVGAMFIFNVFLAAFLVRTEIRRPEARPEARPAAPATSTPLTLERPKAGSSPQLNAPPDHGFRLDVKAPPAEVTPAALPNAQRWKRPPIKALPKALRASKSPRPVLPAPMPRAVVYPPQKPLGQTPAPVRDPAASLGTSANVAPHGLAASIPAAGVRGNAGTPTNSPAASGLAPSAVLAPSAIGHGLAAKGPLSGSINKVASVELPTMENGLVKPKMPVAPIFTNMEIVPRPAEKHENCGDDKGFIACPELKIRYDTPFTSEDR